MIRMFTETLVAVQLIVTSGESASAQPLQLKGIFRNGYRSLHIGIIYKDLSVSQPDVMGSFLYSGNAG